jgi:cyclase
VTPTLTRLTDHVHAWVQPDGSWWLNNAGVVLGDGGVILIDTCATAERTRRLLAAVAEVAAGAPIRLAINTHLHGDHSYGNALLPESTSIVGHPATRAGLIADFLLADTPPIWSPTPDWGIAKTRPPTIVVPDEATLYTGERRVDLRHPGHPAHTEGDLVAWLPDERVLFTGDLVFHGVTPLVFMGSLDGALRSLGWLREFPAEHVVPGHGQVFAGSRFGEVLDAHARYYEFVQYVAVQGLAAGLPPLEAAQRCDLGPFAEWPDQERIVLNLHRAYAEAAGAGADVDLIAAFTDAVTYNGGPLACAL